MRGLDLLAAMMAAWCAVTAWRRGEDLAGGHRRGWRLVGIGSTLASTALAWRHFGLSGEGRFDEWPGHAGLLLALLAFLVAAVCVRPPRREDANPVLLLLDLIVVFATVLIVLWSSIVLPSSDNLSGVSAREAIAIAHATVGGALLLTLLVVGMRLPASGQPGTTMLFGGLAGVGLADVGWTVAWLDRGTSALDAGEALLAASFTVLAFALGRERRRFEAGTTGAGHAVLGAEADWRHWISYPAILILTLIVGRAAFGERYHAEDPVIAVGGLALLALLLVRQGIAIRDARRITIALSNQADRDPLTNLINHRKLHERLERELAHARLARLPIAVAVIDVDHFKQINDALGHVVGDHVLRAIATTLDRACRDRDVAARYAGDEFALILPGLDQVSAAMVGDRLLTEVARLAYWPGPDAEHPVSISVGIAVTRTGRRSGRQMIAAADHALYLAKRNGRNRFAIVNADLPDHDIDPNVDPRRLLTAHPAI